MHTHLPPPVITTISTKGQIVIPKEFRKAAGLEAGVRVTLFFHEDGSLEIRSLKHSIAELFGVANEFMNPVAVAGVSEDDAIMEQVLKEDEETKTKK